MTTVKQVPEHIWDAVGEYIFPDGIPPDGPGVTEFSGGYPDRYSGNFTLEWDHDFSNGEEDEWDLMLLVAWFSHRQTVRENAQSAEHLADLIIIKDYMEGTGTQAAALKALLRLLLT